MLREKEALVGGLMIITLFGSCDVRFRLQMVMHVDMLPANLWGAPLMISCRQTDVSLCMGSGMYGK